MSREFQLPGNARETSEFHVQKQISTPGLRSLGDETNRHLAMLPEPPLGTLSG
jgi:hypothetical protein